MGDKGRNSKAKGKPKETPKGRRRRERHAAERPSRVAAPAGENATASGSLPDGLNLFTSQLIAFRHYLDAEFHIRPDVRVDHAWLALGDQRIPLRAERRSDHVVLTGHSLIPGISGVPDATVHLRGPFGEATFGDLVTRQLTWGDVSHNASARVRQRVLGDAANLDILEIGSRHRKGTRDTPHFRQAARRYVGIDIVEGPNVDLVLDAHRLDARLEPASFDFVYSQFVFEHLAMPWVVVSQINRVLRPGGEVFILTNQSIGLHDLPWDFWRFSESAWAALLNEETGFEILEAGVGEPVKITPLRYHDGFRDHEGGVGFQASFAWARKIADRAPTWDVSPETIFARLSRPYPKELRD